MKSTIITVLLAIICCLSLVTGCSDDDNPVVPPPDIVDTTAPSVPSNLLASKLVGCIVSLTWSASIDDVSSVRYKIRRDGDFLGATDDTIYTDILDTVGVTLSYTVCAYDSAGNESEQSPQVSITVNLEIHDVADSWEGELEMLQPTRSLWPTHWASIVFTISNDSTITGTLTDAMIASAAIWNPPLWVLANWFTADVTGEWSADFVSIDVGTDYSFSPYSEFYGGTITLRFASANRATGTFSFSGNLTNDNSSVTYGWSTGEIRCSR